jgi:hypothetical protein
MKPGRDMKPIATAITAAFGSTRTAAEGPVTKSGIRGKDARYLHIV